MITDKQFNKWFNAFILIGMTVVMVIMTVFKLLNAQTGHAMLIVAAFGSLTGILSTVCSANAKILTFLFGLFDVSIYGAMCLIDGKYGNAALHLLYFLPMQFIGFFQWRKRGAESSSKLKARRLSAKQWYSYSGLFIAGIVVSYFVLAHFDSSEPATTIKTIVLMDAFSMMCNILGQMLMAMAYMDQWYFWIGVNISTVVMWTLTIVKGGDSSSFAVIYLVKYAFYLLNSFNGLRIWYNLSKEGQQ